MTGHQSTKRFMEQKALVLGYASENSFKTSCTSEHIIISNSKTDVKVMPKKKMYTINGITKEYSNVIARLNIIFDTLKQH